MTTVVPALPAKRSPLQHYKDLHAIWQVAIVGALIFVFMSYQQSRKQDAAAKCAREQTAIASLQAGGINWYDDDVREC